MPLLSGPCPAVCGDVGTWRGSQTQTGGVTHGAERVLHGTRPEACGRSLPRVTRTLSPFTSKVPFCPGLPVGCARSLMRLLLRR